MRRTGILRTLHDPRFHSPINQIGRVVLALNGIGRNSTKRYERLHMVAAERVFFCAVPV
jgi:hypothetical protein